MTPQGSERRRFGLAARLTMLLGVVTIAAGLALTIAAVDVRTSLETAALLGGGAALYVAGDVLFRLKLGIEPLRYRLVAIPFLLATIPLGSGVSGMAQLLTMIAVFVGVGLVAKEVEQWELDNLAELERLLEAERESPHRLGDLAVTGDDLIAIGYEEGPTLGAELARLLDAVVDDPVKNDRAALLALAREGLE